MSTPLRTSQIKRPRRYRTVFVDPDVLGHLPRKPRKEVDETEPRVTPLRLIGVDERVAACRRNVRDAARAVLTWMAEVMDSGGGELADVLDDCLRPGPDAQRVNYAALAQRINTTCGTDLTAKRVRTAIANLRRAATDADAKRHAPATPTTPSDRLAQLRRRLTANYDQLVAADSDRREKVRRAIGTELLAAVRVAAGRLIEKPYGEGIPAAFDPSALEGRLLDFVRDVASDAPADVERDLRKLLRVLGRDDGTSESDMKLVVAGARVVCDLLGPDSLPGLLAQLNVQVVGRDLLGTPMYLSEMFRISEAAAALHADRATLQYQTWARRLAEDVRVPAAVRVASYARNNLATHILQRLITGEITDASLYLPAAEAAIDAMRRGDAGFFLLPLTEAIHLTALAETGLDADRVLAHFRGMDEDRAAQLLRDLAKYDSSRAVVEAVRRRAIEALPNLRYRLIAV